MDSAEEDFHCRSGGDEAQNAAKDGGSSEKEPDYADISRLQTHYKILNEEDIKQLQEKDISKVSSLLSVSKGLACTILYRNNWSLNFDYDVWFADEEIRTGEPVRMAEQESQAQVCKICYEEIRSGNMVSAGCGHPFCADCWKTYISTSIKDGPGCLTLRCPEPACKTTVGLDMVDRLVSGDDRDKYHRYLYRSYIEGSRNRKWCPAPGCDLAIEFDASRCKNYDVTCDCSHKFCWNCPEENHRPVACRTVANWIEKNSCEAENTNWLLAYTKPCPKCKQAIEKKHGCNQVVCRSPCGFRFCWVCLRSWKSHKGSPYTCKKYDGRNRDEKSKMNAKEHSERYKHYYERWDYNDKSRKRALNRASKEHLDTLTKLHGATRAQVQFVTEAWEQIVECRRVLKWTYAYVYYLSLENSRSKRIDLFECLLGEAEAALERLQHCAEREMDKYLHFPCVDFKDFRSKLVDLTAVTSNYFENLVRVLEHSLSEVESCGTETSESSENKKPSTSSNNQEPGKRSKNKKPRKRSTYAALYA